jgi:mxaC protein
MNIGFTQPWALLLCLLAALPYWTAGQKLIAYSSVALLPDDPLSRWIDRLIRTAGVVAVICLAVALAGPYRQEQWVERVGTGAHIVLLVDRSSSMNDNFSGRYLGGTAKESKAAIAAELLAEFVGRRKDDLFALVAFSAAPIYVLPLTQDREAVQSAVRSLGSRGAGVTNIVPGLAMALDYFSGQPVTGSRIILLVSDGAARMEPETGEMLRQQFQDNQTSLYWIYLRNPKSGALADAPANPNESTTPEFFLHRFFQSLGVAYQAYEATSPTAVESAIADVEKLENHTLRYREKLPRQDLSGLFYGTALACLLTLLGFKALEVRSWNR